MTTSEKSTSSRFMKRPILIGFSAAVLAVGALTMANAAAAEDSDPSPVTRIVGESVAPTVGATFFPVTPYRAFDSRADVSCTGETGPIGPDEFRIVDVVTDGTCEAQIPPENLVAVAFNLTVTSTVGRGYLAVVPASTGSDGNSTINWSESGQMIANGSVVAVGVAFEENGFISVESGPNGATHFIIDIVGYYAESSPAE